MKRYASPELSGADLVIDATYGGDRAVKNVASEPLAKLTGTGNQGGFRFCGSNAAPKLVVLYSTMAEPDWPDGFDEETGLFTYYGDNRKPGFELHDRRSGRGGSQILRRASNSPTAARRTAPSDRRSQSSPKAKVAMLSSRAWPCQGLHISIV